MRTVLLTILTALILIAIPSVGNAQVTNLDIDSATFWDGNKWCGNSNYGSWFPEVSGDTASFEKSDICWGQIRTKNFILKEQLISVDIQPYVNSSDNATNDDAFFLGFTDGWAFYVGRFVGIMFRNNNIYLYDNDPNYGYGFPGLLIGSYTPGMWVTIEMKVTNSNILKVTGAGLNESYQIENLMNQFMFNIAIANDNVNFNKITNVTLKDPSSLNIPSITATPCDDECLVLPVVATLSDAIEGFQVPLTYAPQLMVCSVSTVGLTTDGWTSIFRDIDNTNGILSVSMAQGSGVELPAGIDTLFKVYFYAPPQCNTESIYTWDTTFSGDPFKQLAYVDTSGAVLLPEFSTDTIIIGGYVPGDFDMSGSVDIADLVAFVAFSFQGGPPPCIMNTIDVNGSGGIPDIGDLVYIVNYMFGGVPVLECGNIGISFTPKLTSNTSSLSSSVINGNTIISLSSEDNILGLELFVTGDNFSSINSEFSNLDLLYRQDENIVKIGLLDLDGAEYIPQGKNNIIELNGEFEIVSAIVVDDKLNSYTPLINSAAKGGLIPDAFSLNQNYPNPFNPTTTISFSLPEASDVKLEVYNINGQVVTTLANSYFEAGNHAISWDGRETASGVYLYKLQAGIFNETKKMLLLK